MERYTLITGASKGIGYELAKLFAKDHHNLILVARSKDLLLNIKKEFEQKYNIKVIVIDVDLTKENVASDIYNKTKELNFEVEHLINNAGFGDYGFFLETSLEKNRNMIQHNITTLSELCYYYMKDMKEKGYGKVLNVASIASFIPGPLMATYYATKAYVLSFTEALSREFKNTGVKALTLCPGTTKTNFFDVASANESNLLKNMKPATPEKVALYGYKRFLKNKDNSKYGFKNRMLIFLVRLVPRKLVRNIAYKIQSKRKG